MKRPKKPVRSLKLSRPKLKDYDVLVDFASTFDNMLEGQLQFDFAKAAYYFPDNYVIRETRAHARRTGMTHTCQISVQAALLVVAKYVEEGYDFDTPPISRRQLTSILNDWLEYLRKGDPRKDYRRSAKG